MNLILDTRWLEPGFRPDSFEESPFAELPNRHRFGMVANAPIDCAPTDETLEEFAARLVDVLRNQVKPLKGPLHVAVSGGYDSRILAFLLEEQGKEPLYVTDSIEEPQCGQTLALLGVPAERRYTHDMDQDDPYSLADASCAGWAPLYSQMRFFPADPAATLVTGLGGGEWFSYPADGWHNSKKHRLPHTNLVNQWLDCWPQYALLPDAWATGYKTAKHPYSTVPYARVAATCRSEWLTPKEEFHGLDTVRHAMLDSLDPRLAGIGWVPHVYSWGLTEQQRAAIDDRYLSSWFGQNLHSPEWGLPSAMDDNDHACLMGGFASWCEALIAQGHTITTS